ncbi:hypothetical protein QWZ03_00500 [Chitinimonas viridis]|uniref:DUF1801 domain-containing protein n=1 Tax=Chitinimonas viridis TaxID=664880 RepID=A0ABT8AZH5_9NEIS|nr:hypothetical protein [Chitinimonas viridis]MDN3575253.1 hypothetical protein [Chitinimonas viridis]
MATADFPTVYTALRGLLAPYADQLVVKHDDEGHYYLDTRHTRPNGEPLFFAATQVKRTYVSFYLMPVYVFPELLDTLSADLRKRMQGKSCFNFKQLESNLLEELAGLVGRGYTRYQEAGYI